MALMEYPIIIDGEEYLVRENAVQTYPPSFPPRIISSPTPEFTDLTMWEHDGMTTFRGGLGQKHFRDKEMFYDNVGTCTWEDDEAKLAQKVTLWKSFSDLNVTADTPEWTIRDMADYNNKMYFSNWTGEWGSEGRGRCLLWTWDGTTLTDLRSQLPAAEINGNHSASTTTLTIKNRVGTFATNDYCLITTCDYSGWEVVRVDSVSADGLTLTVTRQQPLTWDANKTLTYPAIPIPDGSMIYKLSYSAPPRFGGGITSMCVYNNKLFFGTLCGAMFMYNCETNLWYMQPAPTGKSPFTHPTNFEGGEHRTTRDWCIDAMCVFRDKLFVAVGSWLYSYDIATPDGGGTADGVTGNPWGNGFLQAVMDAHSITSMVVYNYAIYFNIWQNKQRAAAIYKYDGVSIYPVYVFDPVSEIRYMAVYDGRIFLAVGRYNYAKSSGVGQLWSYDGVNMRKHLSIPRNDRSPGSGINDTIMTFRVVNDKLYFSDSNTPGLYLYDSVYDSIHRALVAEEDFGCNRTVEGIWGWGDRMWFGVSAKGVYRTDDDYTTYNTGKSGGYYGINYPYVQTSIFGHNLPNLQKLYYRVVLWHSPAVSGQKFHLHYSRNFGSNFSGAHVVTLTEGATRTEVILMEEGETAGLLTNGGFNGTQTGEYGIKATNFSMIIAFVTNSSTSQLTLYGFTVDYLPINHKERLSLRLMAVDNMELPSKGRVPKRGIEKLKALQATYENCRPVEVEHFLLTRGSKKVMMITDFRSLVPDPNVYGKSYDTNYYGVEAECLIELTEC